MSDSEKNFALRQAHEIASEDAYFDACSQIDSPDRRKVFGAGFERGWEAARASLNDRVAPAVQIEPLLMQPRATFMPEIWETAEWAIPLHIHPLDTDTWDVPNCAGNWAPPTPEQVRRYIAQSIHRYIEAVQVEPLKESCKRKAFEATKADPKSQGFTLFNWYQSGVYPAEAANAPAYNPAAGGPTGITDEDAQQGDRFSPCPFCGATAEIITLGGAMTVQCTNDACGAVSGLIYPLMDDVIDLLRERWNKRAAQPASAKPISQYGSEEMQALIIANLTKEPS